VPFGEAARTWFAISLQNFGGPAGQIAVMQRTLVDEKRWIGQQRFLHALNYRMLLPSPEAQQLGMAWASWRYK
jgi:chromate transporter